jgi:hypothetical protein
MNVSFIERERTIDGNTHILAFPIDEAFALGDKVIIYSTQTVPWNSENA